MEVIAYVFSVLFLISLIMIALSSLMVLLNIVFPESIFDKLGYYVCKYFKIYFYSAIISLLIVTFTFSF